MEIARYRQSRILWCKAMKSFCRCTNVQEQIPEITAHTAWASRVTGAEQCKITLIPKTSLRMDIWS